jgi:MFS family permease
MLVETELGKVTSARRAGAMTFALLFSIESLARAFNASVLSIQAYELLGSSRQVSVLSTGVSILVLVTTLMMPLLLGRLRRRWAYTLGIVAAMTAAMFLASHTIAGQVAGTYLRNAGASLLNITLSIYILEHIKKSELTRSEPLRLALSTLSWSAGPYLGIVLYESYGPMAPQLLVLATLSLLLGVFWFLRLKDPASFTPGTLSPANPLSHIKRFMVQPRLRLAWAIAFGRSCYWATFFIYGPLMFIEAGKSKEFAGLVISASQLMLLAAFFFGRLARQLSVRHVITLSFLAISFCGLFAAFLGSSQPEMAAVVLLVGALFCTGLDAVGGIPFLRAVRSYEKQSMSAVYRTYIEFSELIPGVLFTLALTFFATPIVFGILGSLLFVMAGLSWHYLPKSM